MNENRLKMLNGMKTKSTLVTILKNAIDEDLIESCSSNFRCGYSERSSSQFFAPFLIRFINGKAWIVYSTNSIRSDRLCIQQWNAENIKKIYKYIEKAYVVVPDDILFNDKEKNEVEKYNSKIVNDGYYSAIDYIYYQSEFENLIKLQGK